MATQVQIINRALIRLGEDRINTITDDTDVARKVTAIYDSVLETITAEGPEKGWKFARRTYHGIDRDSSTITAFAQASATTTTVTASHTLKAGDMVTVDGTTSYDGTYDVVSVSGTTSFVITATYVANDATGTAYWTSEKYSYRYEIPDCLRVVSVQAGGAELTDWIRSGSYILTNQESSEVDMNIVESITTTTLFPPHFIKVLWLSLAIELAYDVIQSSTHTERLITELYEIVLPKAIAMDEQEKYEQETDTSWIDAGIR